MAWILLDEVKAHLNKTSTADDAELEVFMDAACAMIEDIKGTVEVTPFSEVHEACRLTGSPRWSHRQPYLVTLRQRPVFSITAVDWADYAGLVTGLAADAADLPGWRLLERNLYVPYPGRYTVAYQAGYDTVPANLRMAALELVAHLWRSTQNNSAAGRPQIGVLGDTDQMVIPGQANAMPYRVRELLGLYGGLLSDDVTLA